MIPAPRIRRSLAALATAASAAGIPGPPGATAGTTPAVTHDVGADPHAEVDAVYERFHEGYASLDDAVVADLGEIRTGFSGMFARAKERGERLDIRFRIVWREVRDDLVTDVGYYTLTRTSDDTVASAGADELRRRLRREGR